MNKYNHWIGQLFGKLFNNSKPYAITLGQTTYYSCHESRVSSRWRAHEDAHKRQWAKDGRLKFLVRYIWQWVTKGYAAVDYEIDARRAGEMGEE